MEELISIELLSSGRKVINSYKWKGFGFEGMGESRDFREITALQKQAPGEKGISIISISIILIFLFMLSLLLILLLSTATIISFTVFGDLHQGFARVKYNDCKHEYLLPSSCKKRNFCPSCHQKRVIEFGGQLHEEVLNKVPVNNGYSAYLSGSVHISCMIGSF